MEKERLACCGEEILNIKVKENETLKSKRKDGDQTVRESLKASGPRQLELVVTALGRPE